MVQDVVMNQVTRRALKGDLMYVNKVNNFWTEVLFSARLLVLEYL